jgi:hypothetical protein
VLVLASVIGSEFGILLVKAGRQHFWYDELLTFHVSSLHPFSLLWKALWAGADGMPPSYYGIVQLARMFPGDPHIILRLPSVLGYILTLLAVYWFAQKRLGALVGLSAVLLIILSPFRLNALEARSYTLLVAFFAVSAVIWQRVGETRLKTPLLAVFLALAVSCHHLAIIGLSAFVMAEFTWTLLSRRIRWGVWASLVVASFPFFANLPILLNYHTNFGKSFWSRPSWWTVPATYGYYLGLGLNFTVALIAALGIAISARQLLKFRQHSPKEPEHDFGLPEIVLLGGFLTYPGILVALARLFHSGYVDRYGWPAILGLVLGSVYLLRFSRAASVYVLAALLVAFVAQGLDDLQMLATARSSAVEERWTQLEVASRDEPGIPVVVGDALIYLESVQYSPPGLRDRLVQIVDPDIATRLVGSDTPDRTIRVLAQFVPLAIEDAANFEVRHQRFMLYSGGSFDWITRYLLEQGYHFKLVSKRGNASIYLVELRAR